MRDAANGAEFRDELQRALRPRRPHHLRRRGGAAHVPRRDRAAATPARPTLVIDIGGGSTEYVVGAPRRRSRASTSPPSMGSVRHTERHLHARPADRAEELAALRARTRARSSRPTCRPTSARDVERGDRRRRHRHLARRDRPAARPLRPRRASTATGCVGATCERLLARLAALTRGGAPRGRGPAPRPRADDRRRRRRSCSSRCARSASTRSRSASTTSCTAPRSTSRQKR